jgi:uncharacterized protein (DUF1015 family)
MFLANMDDPGLVVLPTHRLVHALPSFELEKTMQRLAEHFEIVELPGAARDAARLRAAIAERAVDRPTFGLVAPGEERAGVLSLRSTPAQAGLEGPEAVTSLDVTILHTLVLERVLGVDRAAQEAQTHITYVKDTRDALERVQRGEAQVGFIMHPTRVAQVKAVSDAGEVMPQKSTFFYPKIASGLVINPLDSAEDLIDIRG